MAPQRAALSRTFRRWLLATCAGLGAVILLGCGVQGARDVHALRGAFDGLPSGLHLGSNRGVIERVLAGRVNLTGPNCLVGYGFAINGPFGQPRDETLTQDFNNLYFTRSFMGVFPITRISWRSSKTDLVSITMGFQGSFDIGPPATPPGGNWGTPGVAYLDFGEFIVSATVGWSFKVHGINFTTNTGRTIEVGAPRTNWPSKAIASSSTYCGNISNPVLIGIRGKAVTGGSVEQITLVWGPANAATTPDNNGAFVRGVVSATAPWKTSPFPDSKASVIWYSASSASSPPMPTFYKTFTTVGPYAYLHVMANKYAQVYFNGVPLGAFWGSTYDGSPVKVPLRSGAPNTIMVRCASADASGGLAVALLSRFNRTVFVRTDSSWRYFLSRAVSVLGSLNDDPWYSLYDGNPSSFISQDATWVWPPVNLQVQQSPWGLHIFESAYYNSGADVTVRLDLILPSNGRGILIYNNVTLAPESGPNPVVQSYTFTLRGSFLNVLTLNCLIGWSPPGFVSAMYVNSTGEILAVSNEKTWSSLYYGTVKWAPF